MNLEFISIEPHTALGNGFAKLRFKYQPQLCDASHCSIQRIGHQESHLGPRGWQTPSHLFAAFQIERDDRELSFLLQPWAVQHMRNSSNYRVALHDSAGIELAFAIIHWRGIPSFRAKTIGNAHLLYHPPAVEQPAPERKSLKEEGVDSGWDFAPSEQPLVSSAGVTTTPLLNPDTEDLPLSVNDEQSFDNAHIGEQPMSADQPISALPCPHDPTHKILSNMVFCPICSKPI